MTLRHSISYDSAFSLESSQALSGWRKAIHEISTVYVWWPNTCHWRDIRCIQSSHPESKLSSHSCQIDTPPKFFPFDNWWCRLPRYLGTHLEQLLSQPPPSHELDSPQWPLFGHYLQICSTVATPVKAELSVSDSSNTFCKWPAYIFMIHSLHTCSASLMGWSS